MSRKARVSAALVGLMGEGEHHAWTLEDLHAGLARRGMAPDFSSVFRAAEKLTADGVAHKLLLEDGRAHFELVGPHHDHLYCTLCHELLPVPCLLDRDGFSALEREIGAAILEHHLILSGICRNCRTSAESSGDQE
jgi:Fur family transcriptional regulator, ferric uptake regulator